MAFSNIRVTDSLLRRLCDIHQFPIPDDVDMIFFGIRGATPFNSLKQDFENSRTIVPIGLNYLTFRCTIGQWVPRKEILTVYPGSTVPYIEYVKTAKKQGGKGTNQMMPGFYNDFQKGKHMPSEENAHDAFRQTAIRPVRRTANDDLYDSNDLVTFEIQSDNLHAGYRIGVDDKIYGSKGCQIVLGRPDSERTSAQGPWKLFKDRAYQANQTYYPYFLLNTDDYLRVANQPDARYARRLSFGSHSNLVVQVQEVLIGKSVEPTLTTVTGIFDIPTMKAVLAFQKLNKKVATGIVDTDTAEDMDIDLGLA
jgi:Putative peptidoglycan binding domain